MGVAIGEGMPVGMVRGNRPFFLALPFVLAALPVVASVVLLFFAWRLYRRSNDAMARLLDALANGTSGGPASGRGGPAGPHPSPAE